MYRSIPCLALVFFASIAFAEKRPVDYVNPLTGTSNSRWMLTPAASLPFGMVKLGPDNQGNVWNGGYEYANASIHGFSHLHGMSLSGISFMPASGQLFFGEEYAKLHPGGTDGPFGHMWTAGYRSRINKDTESAKPGYYAVELHDYDIKVELTATVRCGLMRLTYPQSDDSRLILNLDFPTEELANIHETYVQRDSETAFSGYVTQSNQYADIYTVYFASELNRPIASMDGWHFEPYAGEPANYGTDWRRECHIQNGIETFTGGAQSGIVLNFATSEGEVVKVRTGISFVSIENAQLNLASEMQDFDWDFDAVVAHAQNEWNELLARVEVSSENEQNVALFYTNFYRSFFGKNILSDVNGEYTDMFEHTRTLDPATPYAISSDGLWGAQWTLAPFWTLVAPDWNEAMAKSLLELGKVGGWIPEAPTGLEYAATMGAQHHNAIIISAHQKGLATFDVESAYEAIKHDYLNQGIEHPGGGYAGNRHLQPYMDYGYVPEEYGPVSNTMEYAYDDWCLGQMALSLGQAEDAAYFHERSLNYRNVFDPDTKYLRRRHADGTWLEDFDPHREGTEGGWNGPGYMEGTAWIYTWFVPHDLPGLIDLLGVAEFNSRLEEGFHKNYVNLGNQPNLQAPFLFNYSGKPWLTQKYTRYVLDEFFDLDPLQGWIGEEDEGQMGSLFCLLSIGLFEMDGGCAIDPAYDLSSPLFKEVVIHLDPEFHEGDTFVIRTHHKSPADVYIQSVQLNGENLTAPKLRFADITQGGLLEVVLGSEPNKTLWPSGAH